MADLPDKKSLQGQPAGILKEKEISDLPPQTAEKFPIVELGEVGKTEAEREGYLERIEKEVELKRPVTGDDGQVLVTSPAAQTPKIVLPTREDSYLNPANWHRPVFEAIRWLLAWTKRIIKMKPGQTVFREKETT